MTKLVVYRLVFYAFLPGLAALWFFRQVMPLHGILPIALLVLFLVLWLRMLWREGSSISKLRQLLRKSEPGDKMSDQDFVFLCNIMRRNAHFEDVRIKIYRLLSSHSDSFAFSSRAFVLMNAMRVRGHSLDFFDGHIKKLQKEMIDCHMEDLRLRFYEVNTSKKVGVTAGFATLMRTHMPKLLWFHGFCPELRLFANQEVGEMMETYRQKGSENMLFHLEQGIVQYLSDIREIPVEDRAQVAKDYAEMVGTIGANFRSKRVEL